MLCLKTMTSTLCLLALSLFFNAAFAADVSDHSEKGVSYTLVDRATAVKPVPRHYYQTDAGCPFAKWSSQLPDKISSWEKLMLDEFHHNWETGTFVKKDKPSTPPGPKSAGFEVNDHNFCALGQGNSLGLVTAHLHIDPKAIPAEYRIGLFKEAKTYPALLRFSDFGPDGQLQLGRVAIKIPFESAWKKEINLLTTESLPFFPLKDFKDVAVFAGDKDKNALDMAAQIWHFARSIFSTGETISEKDNGALNCKNYYSQLPFALGDKAAFKFRFGNRKQCKGKPKSTLKSRRRTDVLAHMKSVLAAEPITFELHLQIHPSQADKLVQKSGNIDWSHEYIAAGSLVIPTQALDADGTNTALRAALTTALSLNAHQSVALSKSFLFHPGLTADEHRPVGQTNEYRVEFYPHQAHERFTTFLHEAGEPHAAFPFEHEAVKKVFEPASAPGTPRFKQARDESDDASLSPSLSALGA